MELGFETRVLKILVENKINTIGLIQIRKKNIQGKLGESLVNMKKDRMQGRDKKSMTLPKDIYSKGDTAQEVGR